MTIKDSATLLVSVLSINFGLVCFDRAYLSFLMPFVQPKLKVSNLQVAFLASALALRLAISGVLIDWLSGCWGQPRGILVASTAAFSSFTFGSGLTGLFIVLALTRLFVAVAEGGILPISQTLVSSEVGSEHRGLALGVIRNGRFNLIGSTGAPLILVPIAIHRAWRSAYLVAALPGLICAGLIWLFVRERNPQRVGGTRDLGLTSLLCFRNEIRSCA